MILKVKHILSGTDPADPGLQITPCNQTGYYSYNIGENGTCYKYFSAQKTQYAADTQCREDNGRLISINSTEDILIAKAVLGYVIKCLG